MSAHHDDHDDLHDRGLAFDLATLLDRRGMLGLLGVGIATLAGCGSAADTTSTGSGSAAATTGSAAASSSSGSSESCEEIPDETGGPYPGDGSNGPNALTQSGIVRSDITSSFGSSTTTAQGVPLTVTLTVQDGSKDCAALADAAVYLWHCDREGRYSMYSDGITEENYLRGVQKTDGKGQVTFTTIFPAAYSGRWPHIHFEVYSSEDEATSAGDPVKTSQLAFPKDACTVVYAEDGYEASVRNLAQTSLESDNVFGDDGAVHQLAAVSGSVAKGYKATLAVTV
jgi:protocatechuate 3,4-dioxygenase beta subunit